MKYETIDNVPRGTTTKMNKLNKYTDEEIETNEDWYRDKVNQLEHSFVDDSYMECDFCGRLNIDFDIAKKTKCDGSELMTFVHIDCMNWSKEERELIIRSERFPIRSDFGWNKMKAGTTCGCAEKPIDELPQYKIEHRKEFIIRNISYRNPKLN